MLLFSTSNRRPRNEIKYWQPKRYDDLFLERASLCELRPWKTLAVRMDVAYCVGHHPATSFRKCSDWLWIVDEYELQWRIRVQLLQSEFVDRSHRISPGYTLHVCTKFLKLRDILQFALGWKFDFCIIYVISLLWNVCRWLQNNFITDINLSFANLSHLYFANLSANQITLVPTGAFANCNFLSELDFSQNLISTIEDGAFVGAGNLTKIGLSQNQMTFLQSAMFTGPHAWQILDLEHNQITSVAPGAFNATTTLLELLLGWNDVESFPEKIFAGLNSLYRLDVSHNRLTALQRNLLQQLPVLQDLRMHNNAITSIGPGTFTGSSTLNLMYSMLLLNVVSCSCMQYAFAIPAKINILTSLHHSDVDSFVLSCVEIVHLRFRRPMLSMFRWYPLLKRPFCNWFPWRGFCHFHCKSILMPGALQDQTFKGTIIGQHYTLVTKTARFYFELSDLELLIDRHCFLGASEV